MAENRVNIETFQVEEGQQHRNVLSIKVLTTKPGCLIFLIIILACAAMLWSSFVDMEFYEMGFTQQTFTGKVNRSKVYFGGRHFLGFQYGFKKFPRDSQTIEFKIQIFNADKLEVSLSGALQYMLNKDELRLLHDTYDLGYSPIIEKTAFQAITIAAPKFTVQEYRLEREKIAKDLENSVRLALGGTCCPKDKQEYPSVLGCKEYSMCNDSDKGVFCVLTSFQLELVSITNEQEERFLKNVLEQEKFYTEQFKQQETVERKKTEQEKQIILNKVNEVQQQALANASYIKAVADAEAKAIVEDARSNGLNIIYSQLNITNTSHKASLDYVRTLLNHKGVSLYVGYKSLIAKEGK